MIAEFGGVASVFGGDKVHVFQDANRAVCNVLKVADRRRDKIQGAG